MEHIEGTASRSVQGAMGPGLVRGVLCGVAAGALAGAGLVVWISVAPSQSESGTPFSVFVMAYGALIGMMVGAAVGLLAAAASLAVLAVGGARRGWALSVVAALVAALVSLVVLNVGAQRADGVLLSAAQIVVVGLGSAVIALWQVRGLVRRLDRKGRSLPDDYPQFVR